MGLWFAEISRGPMGVRVFAYDPDEALAEALIAWRLAIAVRRLAKKKLN